MNTDRSRMDKNLILSEIMIFRRNATFFSSFSFIDQTAARAWVSLQMFYEDELVYSAVLKWRF